jgi:hypothetical protein
MPGKIQFSTNVPVDLALKHPEGMRVPSDYGDGYQIMYTTVDGRKAYFSPTVAAKLAALKPEPGQLLRITKRERPDGKKGFNWNVEKLGEQGNGTYVLPKTGGGSATSPEFAEPAVTGVINSNRQKQLTPVPKPPTSSVVSHARRLIDLHAECMSYAERYRDMGRW